MKDENGVYIHDVNKLVNIFNEYQHRFNIEDDMDDTFWRNIDKSDSGETYDEDTLKPIFQKTKLNKFKNFSFEELSKLYVNTKLNRISKEQHQLQLYLLNDDITKKEIRNSIRSFKTNKAVGIDDIHIGIIKKAIDIIIDSLCILYNCVFIFGIIPDIWKLRIIRPIIKPRKDKYNVSSYRPISLTSYLFKIIEKVLCTRLVIYLMKTRFISNKHFAYLKNKSTIDAVSYLVNNVQKVCKNNADNSCHTIMFDWSSAFDMVRTNILVTKLEVEFKIYGRFLLFIQNYLCNRKSCVEIAGIRSNFIIDKIGVPQGGTLSPILYLLYNDIFTGVIGIYGLDMCMYSDDVCIFTNQLLSNYNKSEVQTLLQKGVDYIKWISDQSGLILNTNPGKSEYICFNKGNIKSIEYRKLDIYLDGKIMVCQKESVKYLGIHLDRKLNFGIHIKNRISKCWQAFNMIKNNLLKMKNIKSDIIFRLVESCIISIMDYGIEFIVCANDRDIKKLQSTQNKIIKAICKLLNCTPTSILHRISGWISVEKRAEIASMQFLARLIRYSPTNTWKNSFSKLYWKNFKNIIGTNDRNIRLDELLQDKNKTFIEEGFQNSILYQISDWNIIKYENTSLKDIELIDNFEYDINVDYDNDNIIFELNEFEDFMDYEFKQLNVFTDGSVGNDCEGGFGVYAIDANKYFDKAKDYYVTRKRNFSEDEDEIKLEQDSLVNEFIDNDDNSIYFREISISSRCSIDFCEMKAIEFALQLFLYDDIDKKHGYNCIKIITDSLNCIQWIAGNYKIRSKGLFELVLSIRKLADKLSDRNIKLIIQFVRGHTDCLGNEASDRLAKEGAQNIRKCAEKDKFEYDPWSGYSHKAIRNEIKRKVIKKMDIDFDNEYNNIIGSKKFVKYFSKYRCEFERKNMDIIKLSNIIKARTNINRLKYFLFNKLNIGINDECMNCNKNCKDTTEHLFMECNHFDKERYILCEELNKLYYKYKDIEKTIFNENDFIWLDKDIFIPSLKDILFPDLFLLSKEDYFKQLNLVYNFIVRTKGNL